MFVCEPAHTAVAWNGRVSGYTPERPVRAVPVHVATIHSPLRDAGPPSPGAHHRSPLAPRPASLVAPLVALAIAAAPARADTLVVTPQPDHVVAGRTVRVTYAGTLDADGARTTLYATVFSYLHPGRKPCARTQEGESNRPSSEQLDMLLWRRSGRFSARRPTVILVPGLYRLCAYLQHEATREQVPDALATALVRARRP
ncbi:MAG: hypothetical protein JWM73_2021 [Solirubrobacterales bacterium]|nr:hypothetical protein [Solirubrobacterales bacterium]